MFNRETVTVVGKTFITELLVPPGIGTGAAYADLDAIGKQFSFIVPYSGIIQSAVYYDLDDEGLQVDLWLFNNEPSTDQTDNSAFALSDTDLLKVISVIQFSTFRDAANGQVSPKDNIGKAYVIPNRKMWGALQARGALNIATISLPAFNIQILSDE